MHDIEKRKTSLPKSIETSETYIEKIKEYLAFKYTEIVTDAEYESEKNYLFIEGNEQLAFIRPQNYEISKTRKYR